MAACGQGGERPEPASATAPATPAPTPDRKYLLERVDDAAVAQVYADGFEKLPVQQKLLVWHLYEAALAGRDIYYDQRYRHNLEMRSVLEAILTSERRRPRHAWRKFSATRSCSGSNTGPYTTEGPESDRVTPEASRGGRRPCRTARTWQGRRRITRRGCVARHAGVLRTPRSTIVKKKTRGWERICCEPNNLSVGSR